MAPPGELRTDPRACQRFLTLLSEAILAQFSVRARQGCAKGPWLHRWPVWLHASTRWASRPNAVSTAAASIPPASGA